MSCSSLRPSRSGGAVDSGNVRRTLSQPGSAGAIPQSRSSVRGPETSSSHCFSKRPPLGSSHCGRVAASPEWPVRAPRARTPDVAAGRLCPDFEAARPVGCFALAAQRGRADRDANATSRNVQRLATGVLFAGAVGGAGECRSDEHIYWSGSAVPWSCSLFPRSRRLRAVPRRPLTSGRAATTRTAATAGAVPQRQPTSVQVVTTQPATTAGVVARPRPTSGPAATTPPATGHRPTPMHLRRCTCSKPNSNTCGR